MAFIQKDKLSRKDAITQAAGGPGLKRKPRVVIHRGKNGDAHMHLDIPEGSVAKEGHLEDLLEKLQARRAAETEVTES